MSYSKCMLGLPNVGLHVSWNWMTLTHRITSSQIVKHYIIIIVIYGKWNQYDWGKHTHLTLLEPHKWVSWSSGLWHHVSDVVGYQCAASIFTSPWRWRQHGPPKHYYPTMLLHSVTTQKTTTWTSASTKTSSLASWMNNSEVTWKLGRQALCIHEAYIWIGEKFILSNIITFNDTSSTIEKRMLQVQTPKCMEALILLAYIFVISMPEWLFIFTKINIYKYL
jgi:hypothetical protein